MGLFRSKPDDEGKHKAPAPEPETGAGNPAGGWLGSDSDSDTPISLPAILDPPPEFGSLRPRPFPLLDARNIYRLPTVAADGGLVGERWLAGASLSGVSHLQHGITGHDSFSFVLSADEESLVMAVADGLGSRPATAQIGATLVSRYVCEALASASTEEFNRQPSGIIRDAIVIANRRLLEVGEVLRVEASQLATTLVLACMPSHGRGPLMIARVGDCGAFLDRPAAGEEGRSDLFRSVFARGAGPMNEVNSSLPAATPEVEFKEMEIEDSRYLVLTSDGLASDLFTSQDVRAWLHAQWSTPLDPYQMIHSLRYARQGSHDDRTALIAWLPVEAQGAQPSEPNLTYRPDP